MKYHTVILRLAGAPADAVAVEWTNRAAPLDSGQGWEPCLRLADGSWRFSSHDLAAASQPHRRGPGVFAGLAVRYRLEAAGPWSHASASRKEILIVSAGETDVIEPLPVAPFVAAAPVLAGVGRIGTEVTVAPGIWGGDPAPQLDFQWRRAGVDIPGATARAYVPVPPDDLCDLSCAVAGRNAAGEVVAVAGPLRATYAPPISLGDLPEEVFDEDEGVQQVETALAFEGENLAFAAVGATIDPDTGVLSVPTDQPVSGAVVTVTATNSGGQATARLLYTVEAAPAVEPAEPAFAAGDYVAVRSDWRPAGQTSTFSPIIGFPKLTSQKLEYLQVQFRTEAFGASTTATSWLPMEKAPGEAGKFRLADTSAPNQALFTETGATRGRFRVRHRFYSDQEWSPAATALPALPLPESVEPTDKLAFRPSTEAMTKIQGERVLVHQVAFNVGENGTEYHGVNDTVGMVVPVAYALAAYSEDPRVFAVAGASTTWSGGPYVYPANTTATQRLLVQLRAWGNASQTMPRAAAGYPAQFELGFLGTVLIARKIPAVWNALTATERTRLSLVVEACGYAACFTHSAANPYPTGMGFPGNGAQRTIRGYTSGYPTIGWNISGPPNLQPVMAAMFFSADKAEPVGTTFQTMLGDFDRDEFAGRLNAAGGCQDAWQTFRRQWTTAVQNEIHQSPSGATGQGPTADQIYASLNNGYTRSQVLTKRGNGTVADTYWRNRSGSGLPQGIRVTQPRRMLKSQLDLFFRHTIRPGYPNPPAIGGRSESGVSGTWGHRSSATIADYTGNQEYRACFTPGTWSQVRNIGQTGMGDEMLQTDGGWPSRPDGLQGASPNIRSSVSYTHNSFNALVSALGSFAVYDLPQEEGVDFSAAKAVMIRALQFFEDCDRLGYHSWAKDGWTNSENWGQDDADVYDVITRYEVARIFAALG